MFAATGVLCSALRSHFVWLAIHCCCHCCTRVCCIWHTAAAAATTAGGKFITQIGYHPLSILLPEATPLAHFTDVPSWQAAARGG